MSVYQVIIICVLICYMQASHLGATECVQGSYPPKGRPTIPSYVVDLDKPATERWNDVMKDKRAALVNLIAKFKKFFLEFGAIPKKIIALVDKNLGSMASTLPAPFGDEIKGIARATNLPLGEIVLFNIFYEIFSVCTSIIAEDLSGKMYHVRNLDFGLFLGWSGKNHTWIVTEALRPLIVNVNFTKGGRTQFKAVSFAGYVGVLTGMKQGVFTLTINERFNLNGGYIGILQWILGKRDIHWMSFLTRRALENCSSYACAKSLLSHSPLLSPAYFILAGRNSSEACIITRSRTEAVDTWLLGTRNSSWFLVETNYDHWKAPLFLDDRRTPANLCMNKLSQNNVGFAGLFDVLSTKPVLNKLTAYASLMQVDSGAMETYLQYCPDPCSAW